MGVCKKIVAAVTGVAIAVSAVPLAGMMMAAEAADGTVVFSADFEDGTIDSCLTGRSAETLELTTDSNYVHSGNYALCIGNRTATWNGPAIQLDDICTPGEKYTISISAKSTWYTNLTMSMQSNDASGNATYVNLTSIGTGDWAEFEEITFTMPEYGGVSIYIENDNIGDVVNAPVNIYVDDIVITELPSASIQDDLVSLKDLYSPYFKVGTAVTTTELASQATKDLINKHFNSITLGNELKPDAILDQSASIAAAEAGDENDPQVDIASARSILNFARDNDIPVRGHVLVWYSQTPEWFFHENYDTSDAWCTEEEMLVRMENYIKNVFEAVTTEYPTIDFYAWDVVNECFLDDGSARVGGTNTSSGESFWTMIFGDNSFIKYAFEYARKYAPEGCKLYYNDYNEYSTGKTQAIVDLVTELAEDDLIDGIGMQSHLDISYPSISAYEKALKAFADTGLDIQVTELDVTTTQSAQAGNNSDYYFEQQAQYYSDLFDLYIEYSDSISAVVFWGTTDDQSWRADRYPLLFNEDYTAKPAYYAIIDGLELPEASEESIVTELPQVTETEPAVTETEPVVETSETIGVTEPEPVETSETIGVTEPTETETELEPIPLPEDKDSGNVTLYGDTTLDGALNVSDVVLITKYVANVVTLEGTALANADCNVDGTVTNEDAMILMQFQLGMIASLPTT